MRKIKPISNQSLFDIALQELGTPEAAFDLAVLNGVSVTDINESYNQLSLSKTLNTDVTSYFKSSGLNIATLGNSTGIIISNFVSSGQTTVSNYATTKGQSVFDIALKTSGSIESCFNLCLQMGGSITSTFDGVSVQLNETPILEADVKNYFESTGLNIETLNAEASLNIGFLNESLTEFSKGIFVEQSQSLFDVSVQINGSLESVFDLALLNGYSVTSGLISGSEIINPLGAKKDLDIEQYFKSNSQKIATLIKPEIIINYNIWELPGMLPYSL